MKFTVSSTDLLQGLLSVSRVIASKNSLPILDNFLFSFNGNSLTVTASDSETTLKTIITVDNVEEGGEITIPAKLLTDTLKELSAQPIELASDAERSIINILWMNGNAKIPYMSAEDYPQLPQLSDSTTLIFNASALAEGINSTIYATAEEELRPVMNGIYFDITTEGTTLVASNAHKLVCYTRKDVKGGKNISFILPKKPANILRNNLVKLADENVEITFNSVNAMFKFDNSLMVCRLVEGTYPAYKSVIPKNNTNLVTITRTELLNASRRVAVCSNQATGQVIFKLSQNLMEITAQDLDFSMSARETLTCEYEGIPMEIGFKSTFLIEILSNFTYDTVCIRLADPNRAALIQPAVQSDPDEEVFALLMPMRINN